MTGGMGDKIAKKAVHGGIAAEDYKRLALAVRNQRETSIASAGHLINIKTALLENTPRWRLWRRWVLKCEIAEAKRVRDIYENSACVDVDGTV